MILKYCRTCNAMQVGRIRLCYPEWLVCAVSTVALRDQPQMGWRMAAPGFGVPIQKILISNVIDDDKAIVENWKVSWSIYNRNLFKEKELTLLVAVISLIQSKAGRKSLSTSARSCGRRGCAASCRHTPSASDSESGDPVRIAIPIRTPEKEL